MPPHERPCEVELCPAMALPGRPRCAGHLYAKKLSSVAQGSTCIACKRVLHIGDFVTWNSEPGRQEHAVCPKPKPRTTKRAKGETPLFDGA
jgi:hypothetical protein